MKQLQILLPKRMIPHPSKASMERLSIVILQFILLASFVGNLVWSQSTDFNFANFGCNAETNASISYQNNVNILLSDFTAQSSRKGYYNNSVGDSLNKVYGYYLCRGDISSQACYNCIFSGTKLALQVNCKNQEGILYSDKCMFRFANHSMYRVLENAFTYSYGPIGGNVSNYKQYSTTLSSTLEALINEASFGGDHNGSMPGFATKEANVTGEETIYSLAQCTPDIVGVNCSKCLRLAFSDVRMCCATYQGAISAMPNCQLRYSNVSFYDLGEVTIPSKGQGLKPQYLVLSCSAVFLFMSHSYLARQY